MRFGVINTDFTRGNRAEGAKFLRFGGPNCPKMPVSKISKIFTTTHRIWIIFGVLEREMNSPETFFDLCDLGGGIPSVHLIGNVVSQIKISKKSKSKISKISATTHRIWIIFGGLEREMNSPETFFDLYDLGGGNPSVHLIEVWVIFMQKGSNHVDGSVLSVFSVVRSLKSLKMIVLQYSIRSWTRNVNKSC